MSGIAVLKKLLNDSKRMQKIVKVMYIWSFAYSQLLKVGYVKHNKATFVKIAIMQFTLKIAHQVPMFLDPIGCGLLTKFKSLYLSTLISNKELRHDSRLESGKATAKRVT